MAIPDYLQEINSFGSPHGHPNQADFVALGLTEIEPTSGKLIWNAAGRAVIHEIISTRFERAVNLTTSFVTSKLDCPMKRALNNWWLAVIMPSSLLGVLLV